MATWYLLNTIKFKGPTGPMLLKAGKLIDDTQISLSLVAAAGGVYVPSSDAAAAAAALIANKRSKQGEADQAPATLLDLLVLAAVAGEGNASANSRTSTTKAAGATVAAAAAICPDIAFTPAFSGKVLVKGFASFEALGAGVVTPIVKQGATTLVALAPSSGTGGPLNYSFETEVDGLAVGTSVTFTFHTTAGDATVTLGAGATGIAARFTVQELP